MDTQEKLNMASKLGHTIANILGQPGSSKPDVATAVNDLIVALAGKARGLLHADEVKIEVTMGAGESLSLNGMISTLADKRESHASDCSTNNRGVPELLGACDCKACGQTEAGQTGEYPCKACGVPTVHDQKPVATVVRNTPGCLGCVADSGSTASHTRDCNFEHFLCYSGLSKETPEVIEKIKIAYADQWRPDELVAEIGFPKTMTSPIPIVNEALTDYLRSEFNAGKIDHVVRVVSDANGRAEFYIRPMSADGETVQFVARIF